MFVGRGSGEEGPEVDKLHACDLGPIHPNLEEALMTDGKGAHEKTHRYHQIILGYNSQCWVDLMKVARHLCTRTDEYGAIFPSSVAPMKAMIAKSEI